MLSILVKWHELCVDFKKIIPVYEKNIRETYSKK